MVIRVRPPLPRELQALHRYENTVAVDAGERVVTLSENLASLQGASNPAGTASVDNGVVRDSLPSPAISRPCRRCLYWQCELDCSRHLSRASPSSQGLCATATNQLTQMWQRRLAVQVYTTYRYTFDRVYGPNSEQADVYEHSARDAVHQALEVRLGSSDGHFQFILHPTPTVQHLPR